MCPPGYKLTAQEETEDFILGARFKGEVMQNTVYIFSLKNGSVTVCTCSESRSCIGAAASGVQEGCCALRWALAPSPEHAEPAALRNSHPGGGYGWKCHCPPLGTHQPHRKPSLQELRLAPAKGAAADKMLGGELFLWAAPGFPPPPFITGSQR